MSDWTERNAAGNVLGPWSWESLPGMPGLLRGYLAWAWLSRWEWDQLPKFEKITVPLRGRRASVTEACRMPCGRRDVLAPGGQFGLDYWHHLSFRVSPGRWGGRGSGKLVDIFCGAGVVWPVRVVSSLAVWPESEVCLLGQKFSWNWASYPP